MDKDTELGNRIEDFLGGGISIARYAHVVGGYGDEVVPREKPERYIDNTRGYELIATRIA